MKFSLTPVANQSHICKATFRGCMLVLPELWNSQRAWRKESWYIVIVSASLYIKDHKVSHFAVCYILNISPHVNIKVLWIACLISDSMGYLIQESVSEWLSLGPCHSLLCSEQGVLIRHPKEFVTSKSYGRYVGDLVAIHSIRHCWPKVLARC